MRLNATDYFIIKTPSKRGFQWIVTNHLSDIEFKDIMKLYKYYAIDPFLVLPKDVAWMFAIR